MIEAKNISFSIGTKKIIDAVPFHAHGGETVAICGPNGAGKSTLLRILSGEVHPQTGSVLLEEKDIHRWDTKQLATRRAVLHQESLLSFPFLVQEVVQLGRYPYPTSQEDTEIVHTCLKKVGMYAYKHRIYTSLSGGEKQRVHLARVLAQLEENTSTPKVLMLDEPTSALDLSHQEGTLKIATEYAKKKKYAVIVVLHDLNLAAAWADRIVFLKNGALHTEGSPYEILTSEIIYDIYDVSTHIMKHPDTHRPFVIVNRSQK